MCAQAYIHACGFKAALKAGPDGGAQYFSCCLLLGFWFVCFLVLQKFDYDTWFCFGYRCLSHVLTHENELF